MINIVSDLPDEYHGVLTFPRLHGRNKYGIKFNGLFLIYPIGRQ